MATPVRKVKAAFASPQAFKESVRVPDAPIEGSAYFNEDLLPTPPEKRIWNTLHFFAYYLTQTFSSSSYNLGATLISIGLQCKHKLSDTVSY
jgi:nucleobase:cation symporter-1, NCS1 family